MARFDTSGLDELIHDMTRMGQNSGPVAEAMVAAGAAVIEDAWKESAEAHGLRNTGDMIGSIGSPDGTLNLGGVLARDVYPQGKDRKGTRNAEKAFVLNYGKANFPATYWVDEADAKAEDRVQTTLEEMWGEFLETGKVPSVPAAAGATGSGVTTRTK